MKNIHLLISLCIALFLSFLYSCNTESPNEGMVGETIDENKEDKTDVDIEDPEDAVEYIDDVASYNPDDPEDKILEQPKVADNQVILSVDSNIYLNKTARLHVWIGSNNITPSVSEGMVHDETSLPASTGQYAKITPILPNSIEIEGQSEFKCYKIHPSGSEVIFILKPKESGIFKVSAQVEVYELPNCEGLSTPKITKTLSVNVRVDKKKERSSKYQKLWDIAWDKFILFWGALIALILATILFLIRKKIKNKTGYDGEKE